MNIKETVPADAIDIKAFDHERCVSYVFQVCPFDYELYSISVCEDTENLIPLAIDDAEALKFFDDAIADYEHEKAGNFYG